MNTDAERVVPLLEKLLADPKTTPRLKSKALFVLGQSRSPRAGEIIAKYAKGGSNPDVQLKAVEYLGIYGTPQNKQVLSDVYGSTNDPALKRAVLRAYMIAKDKDKLLAAAKSESNMDLAARSHPLPGKRGSACGAGAALQQRNQCRRQARDRAVAGRTARENAGDRGRNVCGRER